MVRHTLKRGEVCETIESREDEVLSEPRVFTGLGETKQLGGSLAFPITANPSLLCWLSTSPVNDKARKPVSGRPGCVDLISLRVW